MKFVRTLYHFSIGLGLCGLLLGSAAAIEPKLLQYDYNGESGRFEYRLSPKGHDTKKFVLTLITKAKDDQGGVDVQEQVKGLTLYFDELGKHGVKPTVISCLHVPAIHQVKVRERVAELAAKSPVWLKRKDKQGNDALAELLTQGNVYPELRELLESSGLKLRVIRVDKITTTPYQVPGAATTVAVPKTWESYIGLEEIPAAKKKS